MVACESSNGWRPEAVTSGGVLAVAGEGRVQGVIVTTLSKMQRGIWAKIEIISCMSIIKIMAPGSLSIVHNPS